MSDYDRRRAAGGTLQRVLGAARRAVRRPAGRAEEPPAGAIDSPSVRAAAGVPEGVGTDGGKKVRGRERHTPTDTVGLLSCVSVTAANAPDGRAAPAVLDRLTVPDRASLEVVSAVCAGVREAGVE